MSNGTVAVYDAVTGGVVNASFITGLNSPLGLAISGNNLFVANFGSGTVGEYDATTGATINANFVTGLNGPVDLAVRVIPEASTYELLVGGLGLLFFVRRRSPSR